MVVMIQNILEPKQELEKEIQSQLIFPFSAKKLFLFLSS